MLNCMSLGDNVLEEFVIEMGSFCEVGVFETEIIDELFWRKVMEAEVCQDVFELD